MYAPSLEKISPKPKPFAPGPLRDVKGDGGRSADAESLEAFQSQLDYVHRTLRRLGAPQSEVEDLAQDVFLALRRSWGQYDRNRPLRPYLFGVAFRIASAHYRKRRREVALGIVDTDDSTPGPEDVLHAKQARRLVLAALERIPLPRRAVLVMRELDDVPVNEIASALAIPLFTTYSRLRKGRRELEANMRRLLRQYDVR
jgi:RNA polymerase sigma-70 factor (ECF subfamily)